MEGSDTGAKVTHCGLKQVHGSGFLQKQLSTLHMICPETDVWIWWIFMVPLTVCRSSIRDLSTSDISSSVTLKSVTEDLTFDSSSNNMAPLCMSIPFATRASAVLFTAAPTPSAGPLPWPASRKFHVTFLNPILKGSVDRKKKFFLRYATILRGWSITDHVKYSNAGIFLLQIVQNWFEMCPYGRRVMAERG